MDENPYQAPQTEPQPSSFRDFVYSTPARKNANGHRYTPAQILCGLREVWSELLGVETSFSLETRIDENLKAAGIWEEIDFADVIQCVEKFFGFQCPTDEWVRLFQFDRPPTLTFGELAQFIADRAAFVSLEAASVFGRPCKAAGAFFGIRHIASQIRPSLEPFGPSTRIRDRLRGMRLEAFWRRVRWVSENRIPTLPVIWSSITGYALGLGLLSFIVGLIAGVAASNPMYAVSGLLVAVVLYVLSMIYIWIANPLPDGIDTFGDLARLLADEHSS